MNTQYRYNERIDPAAVEQHDRLAMRIWKLVAIGGASLFVAVWMVYLTSTGAITTANDWWVPLGLAGWFAFVVCGVGVFMFALMISHLPEVKVTRSRETVVESAPRPSHVVIERIDRNSMQIAHLKWDMSEDEAAQFAAAVIDQPFITRKLVKQKLKLSRGYAVKNINARFGSWMHELARVGAVEHDGQRFNITDEGYEILRECLPHPEDA